MDADRLPFHVVAQVAAALALGRSAVVRLPDGRNRTYRPDGATTTTTPTIAGNRPISIIMDEM